MRKWGDVAHWRFPVELLGKDSFGTWLGARPPTSYTGPRGPGEWSHNFVLCVPDDKWWIATFNAVPFDVDGGAQTYVDMTTVPVWLSESHVQAIDLDLDVIRNWDGSIMLDDEDEFEEHRVLYRYPDDVIAATLASAASVLSLVETGAEPFGEVYKTWLAK